MAGRGLGWLVASVMVLAPVAGMDTTTAADTRTGAATAPKGSAGWALAQAKRTDRRVRVAAEQAESRDVYANPDGSFTADFYLKPVRARKGSGWAPIDTTLRRRSDGTVAPAATPVSIVLSGGGDREPMVRLARGRRQMALRWPGDLPRPTLSGGTATYREVLPGVDLRIRAKPEGFSKVLVVKTRAAAADPRLAELRFGLESRGVKLRSDRHGNIGGYDGTDTVFGLGAPMMWDSSTEPRRALGGLRLAANHIALIPDRGLLADTAARFPIYIDPDTVAPLNSFSMVFSGSRFRDQAFWGGDGETIPDGRPIAKVGFCDTSQDGRCNNIGVARTYFQFTATGVAKPNIRILGATFRAFHFYAPSCNARGVEAWGTNPVDARTTWNSQPFPIGEPARLGTNVVAYGYPGCHAADWLGWNATQAVVNAAKFNGGKVAIMLKAANEGDWFGWKKLLVGGNTNPTLSVRYNTYPNAPYGQTTENKPCAQWPNEPYVNPQITGDPNQTQRGPRMSTAISDPDGGLVHAQFEWFERTADGRLGGRLGITGPGSVPEKGSGSTFSYDIPSAQAADDAKIRYHVRGADGLDVGPWGSWCDVTVDRTRPDAVPTVSSATYPECRVDDDECPSGSGGVGRTGGFTFGANSVPDVAGFRYHLADGHGGFAAVGSGGTANALITPPDDHQQVLTVWSVDRAGNEGPQATYRFNVGPWTPPRGHWRLEGLSETTARDYSPNRRHGTVTGGWTTGRHGDAVRLNGTGDHVGTSGGPAVRTNMTFSVAAWVKPDRLDGWRTVVSQDADQNSGFYLQYNPVKAKWSFAVLARDDTGATQVEALSPGPAVAGRWTHLVGIYDAGTKQIQIYVDGAPGTAAGHTTPWEARGTLQIGRARWAGAPVAPWSGAIDDVRAYDRRLAAEEIQDLASLPADEELFLPLDDGEGQAGGDVSGHYRNAIMTGGGTWVDGDAGTGAVHLDGTGWLATDVPAVRTDTSFTVTARVRPESPAETARTAVSQDGATGSGFTLGHRDGRWTFRMADPADPSAFAQVRANVTPNDGVWANLAGVYDAASRQIRIHVDGALQGTAPLTAPWRPADGPLVVGRAKGAGGPTERWQGAIDDVHAWTGVRTPDQIRDDHRGRATGRKNAYAGQLGRFVDHAGHHFVTTGPAPAGYHFERSLGMPVPPGTPGTRTIYSCRNNALDQFLSSDPGCENKTRLGSTGALYVTPPRGVPTTAVYRCLIPGHGHFASPDDACEGRTTEFLLGYARAYQPLIRNLTLAYPPDHLSSTVLVPADYRPEFSLGVLASTQVPDTVPLYLCRDDAGHFTSTQGDCEDGTLVRRVGFIWTSPPEGVTAAAELFRCRASWGDLFDSADPGCEGQARDRSLGYVVTRL